MKFACVQMTSTQDVESNLQQALDLIALASAEGADLIALPENCLFFGSPKTQDAFCKIGEALEHLLEVSSDNDFTLLLGSVPVNAEGLFEMIGGKLSSRSMIFRAGKCMAHYDKAHMFDVDVGDAYGSYRESDTYQAGNKSCVFSLSEDWALGLSICFDVRFPALYQSLRQQGANVIAVPAAFTARTGEAHWELLLKARAVETQSYIIAPNQCGDHGKGRTTWGHSMIVDPWGRIIARCKTEPGICVAELDLEKLQKIREAMPLNANSEI